MWSSHRPPAAGRLYSIPETRQTAVSRERLVTTEWVCGPVSSTTKERKPMNTKMYETVRNVTNNVTNWLNKHSFKLVLIMSLFHIGLAYIHTRDSGRADPLLLS